MKRICLFLLLFINSYFLPSQTTEQKIEHILESQGYIENYKYYLTQVKIEPLKYNAEPQDSLRLANIEKKLTDTEIKKRLSKSFAETYNKKEIDEMYQIFTSSIWKKIMNSQELLQSKFNSNFEDILSEADLIQNKITTKESDEYKLNEKKEVLIDREDGFYRITNFEGGKYNSENPELLPNPEITGSDILTIDKSPSYSDSHYQYYQINITLTKNGAKKFKSLTEENIGKPLAIVINKKLISIPTINSTIPNGEVIVGLFSEEEAEKIIQSMKK